jgi:hypothetical protein
VLRVPSPDIPQPQVLQALHQFLVQLLSTEVRSSRQAP